MHEGGAGWRDADCLAKQPGLQTLSASGVVGLLNIILQAQKDGSEWDTVEPSNVCWGESGMQADDSAVCGFKSPAPCWAFVVNAVQ